ncbi:hypothetical protein R3P38DRAFT_1462777 [Favolaschia claudopus]|uniref:Uncharacterized protein n=1 Tax=Favolaschia claudopus TaxID=2862362 RepID=A0AAW0DQ87_9AGAR
MTRLRTRVQRRISRTIVRASPIQHCVRPMSTHIPRNTWPPRLAATNAHPRRVADSPPKPTLPSSLHLRPPHARHSESPVTCPQIHSTAAILTATSLRLRIRQYRRRWQRSHLPSLYGLFPTTSRNQGRPPCIQMTPWCHRCTYVQLRRAIDAAHADTHRAPQSLLYNSIPNSLLPMPPRRRHRQLPRHAAIQPASITPLSF